MKATSTLVFVESVFRQTTKILETYFWEIFVSSIVSTLLHTLCSI